MINVTLTVDRTQTTLLACKFALENENKDVPINKVTVTEGKIEVKTASDNLSVLVYIGLAIGPILGSGYNLQIDIVL